MNLKALKHVGLIIILLWTQKAPAVEQSAQSSNFYENAHQERIIPKPLFDSIIFGVSAGTLVGIAAITGFHKNFAKSLDFNNIFRGASYGLYGGIILGIYRTYYLNDTAESDDSLSSSGKVYEESSLRKNNFECNLRKSKSPSKWIPSNISPQFNESRVAGIEVQWTLLTF